MNRIKLLIKKELLDILRDKKTLIMMVAIPILLYPLIIIGMTFILRSFMSKSELSVYTVGYPVQYQELADHLSDLYEHNQEEDDAELEFMAARAGEEQQLRNETDIWMDPDMNSDGAWRVKIYYTSTDRNSRSACQIAEALLEDYREELVTENLKREGLQESFLHPVVYETEDGASFSESLGMDIGGSIGLMLIVTILLGAIYPAIDATAGEKERGTLETLLTLPVTNFQMILSKYISVAVIACVTAILSLLSLGGSVLFLIYGVSNGAMDEIQGFSLPAVLSAIPILLITLIATALLATALCMCFCVFAKSFKEANNYITPVLLVVMFASMAGMIPSVVLDYRTALIPIVNVSLLMKQILSQQLDLSLAGMTIAVNLGYSILIIWILAKIYNSENVLFHDGFRSFRLFQKRSDIERGSVPDYGDLVISFTVLFLLLLYIGSAAVVRLGFWGTAVSQLLILAVPLAAVWYMKSDVRQLFSLHRPRKGTIVGSFLLYLGTYCLMLCLASLLTMLSPDSAKNVEDAFLSMTEQTLPVLLLVIAVMPAIGEELLFRGFLFGSLKERLTARIRLIADPADKAKEPKKRRRAIYLAIFLSALVFGVFHINPIRLLPTFLMGVAFACIVWKSGSIYLTMCLHLLNNTISMILLKYPDKVMQLLPFLVQEQLTGVQMAGLLTAGVIAAAAGLILLRKNEADSGGLK